MGQAKHSNLITDWTIVTSSTRAQQQLTCHNNSFLEFEINAINSSDANSTYRLGKVYNCPTTALFTSQSLSTEYFREARASIWLDLVEQ